MTEQGKKKDGNTASGRNTESVGSLVRRDHTAFINRTDGYGGKTCAIIMPAKFADMTEEEMECDGGFPWIAVNCVLGCVCGAVSVFSACMAVFGNEHRGAWAITSVVTAAAAGCLFWNANRICKGLSMNKNTETELSLLDVCNESGKSMGDFLDGFKPVRSGE